MIKKITLTLLLILVTMITITTTQANLLTDFISQGTNFYNAESARDYNEKLNQIEATYNNTLRQINNGGGSYFTKYYKRLQAKATYQAQLEDLARQYEGMELGITISNFIYGDVKDAVWAIGNLIFAAITIILGLKYIWSSAEGRANVMESLPTFVLAVIMFYLADPLLDFIMEITTGMVGASSWDAFAGSFIWIINTIVKYAAFGGIVLIGVKYLLASAEGKSNIKTSMVGLVIGLLLVFLSSNVVEFIINFGQDVLRD